MHIFLFNFVYTLAMLFMTGRKKVPFFLPCFLWARSMSSLHNAILCGINKRSEIKLLAGERRRFPPCRLTSTEVTQGLYEGAGGRVPMNSSSLHSARTERKDRQNRKVEEVRTPPVQSNVRTRQFARSAAVRNSHRVGKTSC